MLIPSIDLMGGKIVQLVQGEKKALETADFDEWIARFSKYPIVQLIDLDAAMNKGSNRDIVARIASKLPCQVGGGIRSEADAWEIFRAGAKKAIVGSSLLKDGHINRTFARELHDSFGPEKLIFAIDSRAGKVSVQGWTENTSITPNEMIETLQPFCGAFLYTHIDSEGLMQGFPMDVITALKNSTHRKLIAAGGITTQAEIDALDKLGIDAVVGMAIYTGRLQA